jgi:serine/threonine protein kinase
MASVNSDSFKFLKVLGQGSFGKVLMAEMKGTQEVFAVKVLKKEVVVEDDDVECTMIERRVLELSGGCEFLTKLVATFQTNEHLYFVMEFITGGDLMFHIQKLKRFSTEQTRFYVGEICLGLWYLHKSGVLYRDLKLDNVMLDKDGHIKIADFGMCKENIWGAATTTTFCGTPGYLAPEIIKELPYGASVDWWSLGVLSYEMLIGDSPFEGDDEEELFDEILRKKLVYPPRLSAEAKALLDGFLTRDNNKRLGCGRNGRADIQGHPFFAGVDWDKLEKRQVTPPYVPEAKDPRDAVNFDREFTEADTNLTPTDPYAIANIDQTAFRGFSFVNQGFFGGTPSATPAETSRRPALFDYPWYRPDLPREEAARNLKGKPVGTFFVRESSSQPGCYAIAMVSENNKIWNGLVTPSSTADGRTLYKLFVKQKFETLPELVDYYTRHPVTTGPSGAKLCLKV